MGYEGEPTEAVERFDAVRARPRWLPAVMLDFGVIALASGSVLSVLHDAHSLPWYAASAIVLVAAALVRSRQPADPLTQWFAVLAGIIPTIFVTTDLIALGVDRNWSRASLAFLTFVSMSVSASALIPAVRLFALFPDGLFRTRVDRIVVNAAWPVLAVPVIVQLCTPEVAWPEFIDGDRIANPVYLGGPSFDASTAQLIVALVNVVPLAAGVALITRYRRYSAIERRRIRWLLLPVVFIGFGLLADTIVSLSQPVSAAYSVANIAVLGFAIAFGLIDTQRLDVDGVLRRSIAYGSLWLLIAGVYIAATANVGTVIGERVQIGGIATITVLVALILHPIRAWLARLVNRRVFGASPDPRRAIVQLGSSLEETVDLDALLPQMESALQTGLGCAWARARLLPGEPPDERIPALSVPITFDDELLGVVECGPRPKGALDDDDAAIVRTFARQAALAVRNLKLTTQLTSRTAELTASRTRLVRAEEAERRRIERDIHDGVQQELVALIGQSGILRRRLSRDGSIDPTELGRLQSGLQQVLSELRDLATGIHPSLLRDQGLLPAVEALAARHPVPVNVRAGSEVRTLRLAVEVEGAGYFTVAESLANSLKHADATSVAVSISVNGNSMSIEVTDDGCGFDATRLTGHSNGLANLTERIAAVGGRLDVASSSGSGTTVAATMPVATGHETGPSADDAAHLHRAMETS